MLDLQVSISEIQRRASCVVFIVMKVAMLQVARSYGMSQLDCS